MQGLGGRLPEEVWQALLSAGFSRPHRRHETLLRQGDHGNHVLLLTAGRVKVTRVERDGRELLLAVRGPGEALGEISALDGSVRSSTVTAADSGICSSLSATDFREILDRFGMRETLLQHVLARLREGEDIRADLADLPASRRVARVLARLAAGGTGTGIGPHIDLKLSQGELANAVGLSRSALAAELARLRKMGLISTSRELIVVRDVADLRLLGEADSDSACPTTGA